MEEIYIGILVAFGILGNIVEPVLVPTKKFNMAHEKLLVETRFQFGNIHVTFEIESDYRMPYAAIGFRVGSGNWWWFWCPRNLEKGSPHTKLSNKSHTPKNFGVTNTMGQARDQTQDPQKIHHLVEKNRSTPTHWQFQKYFEVIGS